MRNSIITNSIANVSRFSVRVNGMLCAFTAPQQQWHLQPFVGTDSSRKASQLGLRYSADTVASSGLDFAGNQLLEISEPKRGITNKPATPKLFLRLS